MHRVISAKGRVLVIGIGNDFRGDDAAGLLAVRKIGERNIPGMVCKESHGEGTELLLLWEHQPSVILIDAVRSGCAIGQIHTIDLRRESLPHYFQVTSGHSLHIGHAIEMGKLTGNLPEVLLFYGIEISDCTPGAGVDEAVERAVGEVVEIINSR